MGILDAPARPATLAPYAAETRPWYLDCFWQHFLGRGFTSGQTTSATALVGAHAQGTNVLNVVDATGYVAKMPLVVGDSGDLTGTKQVFVITSVASNALTVYPKIPTGGFADGVAVYPAWGNDTHPVSAGSYAAFARFISDAKQRKSHVGFNLLGTVGDFETTYTDTNSVANMPSGWESILPANLTSVLQTTYGTTSGTPDARNSHGAFFVANAANAGFRTLASIPVRAGQRLMLSVNAKTTSGHPTIKVVDKGTPTTVIATVSADLADRTMFCYGTLGRRTTLAFTVPVGTTDIEIRAMTDGSGGGNLYLDDMQLIEGRQDPNDDRYVIEDPGSAPIVYLGDSWSVPAASGDQLHTCLENRFGHTITWVNAGVSGNTTTQMIARFATDVAAYKPRYVIIEGFINDVAGGASQATVEANTDTLIALCRSIGAIPVFVGVPPMESQLSTAHDRNEQVRARVARVVA